MNDIAHIRITPNIDIKEYVGEVNNIQVWGTRILKYNKLANDMYNAQLRNYISSKSLFSTLVFLYGGKPLTRREKMKLWLNERRDRIKRALAILCGEEEREDY